MNCFFAYGSGNLNRQFLSVDNADQIPLENTAAMVQRYVKGIPAEKSDTLVIELTVTNRLNNQLLKKLHDLGILVLEIDLSNMGGRITRKESAAWLIHERG